VERVNHVTWVWSDGLTKDTGIFIHRNFRKSEDHQNAQTGPISFYNVTVETEFSLLYLRVTQAAGFDPAVHRSCFIIIFLANKHYYYYQSFKN